MPSAADILSGLATVSIDWRNAAIVWHLVFAIYAMLLAFGSHPPKRLFALALVVPLLSVATVAWGGANPFNGLVFTVLAIVLATIAYRLPDEPIQLAPPRHLIIGCALLAFGWLYPHFGPPGSWVTRLYAAPLGIIPCPTLSAVLGASALASYFGSTRWAVVVKAATIAYGVIGVLWLGVWIDAVLIAAPIVLDLSAASGTRDHDYRLHRPTLHS